MQEFKGKTAVITGAANGIGLAFAEVFAELGMNLVLADIEEQKLQQAQQKIEALGVDVISCICDVGKAEQLEELAVKVEQRFGNIHIMCNNAGVFTGGQLWDATVEDYEWLLNVNVWGVINGIRSFVPRLKQHGEPACIVNTASLAGFTAVPYSGIYNMSKHAVVGLSECLYHELSFGAPQVKAVLVCPELVDTGIGQAERNRPADLAHSDTSEYRDMAVQGLSEGTAGDTAVQPRVLAERTLQAIKAEQFYVFPPKANPWWDTTLARLDDIRERRNPVFAPPI